MFIRYFVIDTVVSLAMLLYVFVQTKKGEEREREQIEEEREGRMRRTDNEN